MLQHLNIYIDQIKRDKHFNNGEYNIMPYSTKNGSKI